MEILWDEPKRLANLETHKLDFAIVTLGFFEDTAVSRAKVTDGLQSASSTVELTQ